MLIFTDWLGHRWVFQSGSVAGTDVLLRSRNPTAAEHCRLVTINIDEFKDHLGEPLDPNKLAFVLGKILEYQPAVVVVDIDTSASRFQSLLIPHGNSTIVWARVSFEQLRSTAGQRTQTYEWKGGTVLGDRNPKPEYFGSPLFPQDPNSTVRSFQRVVQTDAKAPALYWETLRAYCHNDIKDDVDTQKACQLVASNGPDDELKVRAFHRDWDFTSYPLSDLMNTEGNMKPQKGRLGDIVLLGASFSDIHPTPFGPRLGIELTASAIETELAESEPSKIPEWVNGMVHWFLKISLGIFIAWLNSRLLPLWATAGTLLLLGAVFVASFLGMYYGVFQMDFLPFMIGIWIEQLVESSERAHRMAQ